MSELSDLITTLGIPLAVILWITTQVVSLVRKQGPEVVQRYQDRKLDREEHVQGLESQKLKHQLRHDELLALTEAGNRTYTEEQLTQHLSELYEEFNTVNAFVRNVVDVRLRNIEENTNKAALLAERLAEIRMYVRAIHKHMEVLDEENSSLYSVREVNGSTIDNTGSEAPITASTDEADV